MILSKRYLLQVADYYADNQQLHMMATENCSESVKNRREISNESSPRPSDITLSRGLFIFRHSASFGWNNTEIIFLLIIVGFFAKSPTVEWVSKQICSNFERVECWSLIWLVTYLCPTIQEPSYRYQHRDELIPMDTRVDQKK